MNAYSVAKSVPLPASTRVIAVKGIETDGGAGILGSTADGSIVTGQAWRCTDVQPASNWMTVCFNDAAWPAPPLVTKFYNPYTVAGISASARPIWTANHSFVVYCRFNIV